jgi:hypothetical protein
VAVVPYESGAVLGPVLRELQRPSGQRRVGGFLYSPAADPADDALPTFGRVGRRMLPLFGIFRNAPAAGEGGDLGLEDACREVPATPQRVLGEQRERFRLARAAEA